MDTESTAGSPVRSCVYIYPVYIYITVPSPTSWHMQVMTLAAASSPIPTRASPHAVLPIFRVTYTLR